MKRLLNDFSESEKEDLLQLYFFNHIQINDLAEIFKTSWFIVSKIITEDIKKRQSKKEEEDECE